VRVQVIERAVDCVNALSDGPKTLTEVMTVTGLPKGTTFRILSSLSYGGVIAKDPVGNRYMLGPGILRLVRRTMDGVGALATLAQPSLARLSDSTDETAALHIRLGLERLCVAEVPSRLALRYTAGVGASAPLYVGSAGKILLAYMNEHERHRLLSSAPLVPMTAATITDIDELEAEIERVGAQGWATSEGERLSGGSAISVPVTQPDGEVAALSVLGPAERLSLDRRMGLLDEVKATAAAITAATSGT
jgi:DNA-binding IclR family transcriptional regulator